MLDLTEPRRDGAGLVAGLEHLLEVVDLDHVADAGRGAVGLDVADGSRGEPARCQARSMASFWPTGLGAVMPLPLPSLARRPPRMTA